MRSNLRQSHFAGDVTLSAEDLATTRTYSPSDKDVTADLIDHTMGVADDEFEEEDLMEEEQHGTWMGGALAVRFLLAGGIAGAGTEKPAFLCNAHSLILSYSLADVHSAV